MVFIINLLFLILIICTLILALIEINTVDVLLSRSGIIANHASVIINGKIKPQKMYFQLMGYKVLGAYQGHEIIVNLRQEFITVSIHISHKLPKQNLFFMYNPKYTGDVLRVGKDFSIYLKQSDILEGEIFLTDKFEIYLKKLMTFIDEVNNKQ